MIDCQQRAMGRQKTSYSSTFAGLSLGTSGDLLHEFVPDLFTASPPWAGGDFNNSQESSLDGSGGPTGGVTLAAAAAVAAQMTSHHVQQQQQQQKQQHHPPLAPETECGLGFSTKQCLQVHLHKAHGFSEDNMPQVQRSIPYTFDAYSGGVIKDPGRGKSPDFPPTTPTRLQQLDPTG